jgi:hypothetical protein
MKDPNLLTYCERIEHEFFRLKGRPGTLSPADFARASEWYRSGVSLQTVLEGIADAFENQGAGRDREAEEVNSLAYCESFVAKRGRLSPS